MANNAPSFEIVSPSFIEPGILMPYFQASGAFGLLGGGAPMPRLGSEDLYVYMKALDVRTRIAAGQSAYNSLPSIAITPRMISTPSYLMRVRGEWDHHDIAAWGRWGVALPEAQRLGMRQAHFLMARNALLYGFNPANGEGLLYAVGAVQTTLPPDTNGNTTWLGYDNGEMAFFLASVIQSMKTRTYQMGIPHKFTIIGPQRVLGPMEYQNIVQLVQFQRAGAGTAATAGVFKSILGDNGDTIEWGYDDTLQGKGAGGTDAVIIVMPEVRQSGVGGINTNTFAELEPGILATTSMYCDMAAPREITSPLPGGAVDVLQEWRITSGWGFRPEGITVISGAYS